MEKNVTLKVIYDDGYKVEAIRACFGPKLGVGRVLIADIAEIVQKEEIFNEKVSEPAASKPANQRTKN